VSRRSTGTRLAGSGPSSDERYDSFVVRVLVRCTTGTIIHGHVTHMPSGRRSYFTNPQRVVEFMYDQLGASAKDGEASSTEPA
jgi:hypothetical protein